MATIKSNEHKGSFRSPRLYIGRVADKEHEEYGRWSLWMVDFIEIMHGHIMYYDTMAAALEGMHEYLDNIPPKIWERIEKPLPVRNEAGEIVGTIPKRFRSGSNA